MQFLSNHKGLALSVVVVILVAAFLAWQVLYITRHFTASVSAPDIPRTTERFGTAGPELNFVVMGDSTSIGQGADYAQGIARMSAGKLAATHRVALTNVGVSGARVADVRTKQLAKAVALRPDLVLLAIGANDVTHLTRYKDVRQGTETIITTLKAANPNVQIILTGSPAMGSVSRFAPPTQWLAGQRVRNINNVFADVARQQDVLLIPLAAKTAYVFKHDPSLFASDNFHPNARGYALWQPVIDDGLRQLGYAVR